MWTMLKTDGEPATVAETRLSEMAEDTGTNNSDASDSRVSLSQTISSDTSTAALLARIARLEGEAEVLRRLSAIHDAALEDLGRRKDEFVVIASHDLKTPLTGILGYAQYAVRLLSTPEPDLAKLSNAVESIRSQGYAMNLLLDDLLDASRMQMNSLELRPAACDIVACLSTILARLSPESRERVEVTAPVTGLAGQWDQNRIEQVLANLVSNALKYSPDDARVMVVVAQQNTGIEVAVSDQGMGIPANELLHVFERFHRTPQAHASGLAGSGLGLYICQGIIAAHGGRLWAESPGENLGATFRFTLPHHPPPGDIIEIAR